MSELRVLFFGTVVAPDEVARNPITSIAANNFQLGLLGGLVGSGAHATAVTSLPIAAWPGDALLPSRGMWRTPFDVEIRTPGFVNVKPPKPLAIEASLARVGTRVGRDFGANVVMTYNPIPGHGSAAVRVARRLRLPLVTIVADHTPPEGAASPLRRLLARQAERVVRRSDGLVVLSSRSAVELARPGTAWMKLDGGVAEVRVPAALPPPMATTAVWSGAFVPATGIELMLRSFAALEDKAARLIVTGRGPLEPEVRAAAAFDQRIDFRGLVDRSELERILGAATVLVNSRPSDLPENAYNFPSKLLEYLAAGRPVATTLAGDIGDDLRAVTVPLDPETPPSIASTLAEVFAWPEEQRVELGTRGRELVRATRTWEIQGERVKTFLDEIVRK